MLFFEVFRRKPGAQYAARAIRLQKDFPPSAAFDAVRACSGAKSGPEPRLTGMHPVEHQIQQTRREFFNTTASGLGALALGSLLTQEGLLSAETVADPLQPKAPHFPAKAKNCIFIFFEGGPSQMDLFDPKPKLNELNGQSLPDSMTKNVRFAFIRKETAKLMGSPRKFAKHG